MKDYKERAVDLVVAFYDQIVGSYDVEEDFKEPELTQARRCALMHLDIIKSNDDEFYGFISDDEKWKI